MEDDLNLKVNGRRPQFLSKWKTTTGKAGLASPSFSWAWHSSAQACYTFFFAYSISTLDTVELWVKNNTLTFYSTRDKVVTTAGPGLALGQEKGAELEILKMKNKAE